MGDPIINTQVDAINATLGNIKVDLAALRPSIRAIKDAIAETYLTDTIENVPIASFSDGADEIPVRELQVAIEPVQSGTGDPSPTNVRPISGHTEVKVMRTGVNLWDKANVENGYIDDTTGEVKATAPYKNTGFVKVLPNTQYYIKTEQTASAWGAWYDADKRYISGVTSYHTSPLITSPNNASYVRLTVASSGIGNINTFGINYPSTATDYEPFGQTYPISLGQTVYGGTLNVTTGVLTINMAEVDLGTLTWSKYAPRFYAQIATTDPDCPKAPANDSTYIANAICSQYSVTNRLRVESIKNSFSIHNAGATTYITVHDDSLTSGGSTAFKSAMSGVQLCYELATPTTVQLTAAEVETLFGQNNVWADTGNVVKLTYRKAWEIALAEGE